MLTFIPVLFVSPSLSPNPTSVLSLLAQPFCPACTSRAHLPVLYVHGPIPARSERCVQCLSSTPLMGRSTPSTHRVEETRTALLEEPGIGVCCGREFLWETEKNASEKLRLSHIGIEDQDTHHFYLEQLSMCVFIICIHKRKCVYICNVKLLEHLAYFISYKGKLLTSVEVLRKYIDIMPEFCIPKCQKWINDYIEFMNIIT